MVINALLAITEAKLWWEMFGYTHTQPMVSVIVKLIAHEMMFHIARSRNIDIKRYTKSIIEEWISMQGPIIYWRMNVFERPLGNV